MRRLLAIIALSATSHSPGAAPAAALWPISMSYDASALDAFGRDGVVLARNSGMGGGTRPQGGGMSSGGGGMNCGANCGGGGMGGASGGMGGASGGMGGSGGGPGGWSPFLAVPRANCPDHPHKGDRRHTAQNSEKTESPPTECSNSR
jgi:hypothetical protein